MASAPSLLKKLQANGELWVLIKHSLLTGLSTLISLLLRYALLLFFRGSHELTVLGRSFTVTVDDSLAYLVYYISGVVLMYLFRWFTASGVRVRSFLPRLVAFGALYTVSMLAGNALLGVFLGWGIHSELAFWLTCPVTFLINYLGSRLIVFCDSDSRQVKQLKEQNSDQSSR